MRAVSLLHGSRSQQTFVAAMALLVAVAAAQILSALYLSTRHPGEPPSDSPQNAAVARLFKQSSAAPVTVPAVEGVPRATVRRVQAPPTSVAETLLRVARGFRDRGDTTDAIAKLQQATALDPGNPEILAELALTYEAMQLFDRSNEAWRRLQSLGSAVGPLYELAEVKLRVGVPAQSNALTANGSPAPAGAPPSDAAGIPTDRPSASPR